MEVINSIDLKNLCGEKTLIIVTGISASGKTTLATKLKEKLKFKYFALDTYKTMMYEQYGFYNETERSILWNLSKNLFELDILKEMRKGKNLILDYPFDKSWNSFFESVSKTYDYTIIVINCNTRCFDDIWESRVSRDSSNKREKCLTAQAYIKNRLYESNNKLNDEYREIKRQEYINEKYTQIKGDKILTDLEVYGIIE